MIIYICIYINQLHKQSSNIYQQFYYQFMWNLKASSKLVQKRSQQKSYQIHRNKLKSMNSKMKVESPYQPDFIYAKHKLKLSRRDRQIQIDRHNEILLNKMNTIKNQEYTVNRLRPQAQNLKTLNAHTMQLTYDQIATENRRFCQKLMRTRSYYPTHNIIDKTEHLEYIASNISHNARRAMSAKSLNYSRPKSSYTTTFSTQRFRDKSARQRSSQNYKFASKFQKGQNYNSQQNDRPETAPMFSRSQKILVVPKSGKPRVQNLQEQQEEHITQL